MSAEQNGSENEAPKTSQSKADFFKGEVFIIKGLYFKLVAIEQALQMIVLQTMTPHEVEVFLESPSKEGGEPDATAVS